MNPTSKFDAERLAAFLDGPNSHKLDTKDAALAARCIRACLHAAIPVEIEVASDAGPAKFPGMNPFIGPAFFEKAIIGH